MQRILAFSSSRYGQGGYLETAVPLIADLLGGESLSIAFIPFAAVKNDYSSYTAMVTSALASLPYQVETVTPDNAGTCIANADVIMTGGGNTFKLLHDLYAADLMDLISEKVNSGTAYIGWSAGSNITGPTICTTNDMPVIAPPSFKALGFFPFQINPHYSNYKPEGFNGETRDQRLEEFLLLNPGIPVVALPEGSGLKMQDGRLHYFGQDNGYIFRANSTGNLIQKNSIIEGDLSELLP